MVQVLFRTIFVEHKNVFGVFRLFDAIYKFLFLLKLAIKFSSAVIVYYFGDKNGAFMHEAQNFQW